MADLKCPDQFGWDPFCQRVQKELVDHLALDNAVISVDRHNGRNAPVEVNLSHRLEEKAPLANHHPVVTDPLPLTMEQLTGEVQSIVDELLEDCDVDFGGISFHVKRRLLERVVFSYSKRPQESTACFFVVNV